jgi:FAD synthetase
VKAGFWPVVVMRKVMAFGTFDLIHLGHLKYLESARAMGDSLVVVVARDRNVIKAKGRLPHFTEKERLHLVSALKPVSRAVLGSECDSLEAIAREKPAVIVLGYDQPCDEKKLRAGLAARGINARVVRLKRAYEPDRHKSSAIRAALGGKRAR